MAGAATTTATTTMLGRLASIPKIYPMTFGVAFSTVKTSGSDLAVQMLIEKRETIDWRRNIAFGAFGCFYLGGVQYALYVNVFGKLFPGAAAFAAKSIREKVKDVRGMGNMVAQVFLDQCVHHPLMYFPVFYCTKELVVNSENPDFKRTLLDYKDNFKEDMLALWKIWVPATIINFSFMPMWGRIPFVASVSLVWTAVLSAMRGGDVAHKEELIGAAVTGATLQILKESYFADSFTDTVELDRDMHHVALTASGPDRRGLVAALARAVSEKGGNVTHSKMVRLGKEFIILMHVAVPTEEQREILDSIRKSENLKPLTIQITSLNRRETGKYEKALMGLRIQCVGEDKPGMLAAVAEKIRDEGLCIDNLTTEVRMNKERRREFVVNANCTAGHRWDQNQLDGIVSDLSHLKQSLGLDVLDIRVHHVDPESSEQ